MDVDRIVYAGFEGVLAVFGICVAILIWNDFPADYFWRPLAVVFCGASCVSMWLGFKIITT